MKETKDHIERALGHIKEASEQSGLLSEAIKTVPGVQKEADRLAVEQAKSDGLVQDQRKKVASKKGLKAKSSNPKSKLKKTQSKGRKSSSKTSKVS